MEKNHIKIRIDANGNVCREVVEEPPQQQQRAKFLKKIVRAFSPDTV